MKDIQKEDIQILSRHSNLSEKEIDTLLKNNIYSSQEAWQKFLKLFLISLGIGFTVSGIIFFFAYNWTELPKFAKIGLTEALIIVTTGLALFPKINANIRNIILTGAAALVGVLFAVFGQVYQTGADAYDFFLAWTIFITLWVIISDFAPLWLLYVVLMNTTLILYSEQVAKDWDESIIILLLFVLNAAILIGSILLSHYKKLSIPNWFTNVLSLAVVSISTFGLCLDFVDSHQTLLSFLIPLSIITYALGIWYGFKTKNSFYFAIIPLSLVIIICSLLFRIGDDKDILNEGTFLLVFVFVIASITLIIKNLMNLQKKWKNEK
ncbi:DUF2157 domain-containing protein [Chryseobacterium jejuense]|uniref:Predicted membrane protein n=1 Tax=Chryseobacterium jejuense TaxID=445960 RepID=A0A2X2X0C3_CHRJE|nr:DUF2157 domain-containing protein [Chryseobacterium jejuense]SDJ56226.1 Predicted membrane protein [Chryseobacterium jejuense]SQB46194.1 Predicted membrane protein [Chryseobacterium jejuense]